MLSCGCVFLLPVMLRIAPIRYQIRECCWVVINLHRIIQWINLSELLSRGRYYLYAASLAESSPERPSLAVVRK